MPHLYVLVSTIDGRITQALQSLAPPVAGVSYVVSWQQTSEQAPVACSRSDVTVVTMQGTGLSRNRNNALEAAVSLMGDAMDDAVFIIADDDTHYDHTAFVRVRDFYATYPRVDIALMRVRKEADGAYLKPYPQMPVSYRRRPRSYYASSVEMTLRARVFHAGLRFDERFGLGAPVLSACEEEVFLTDAMRKGLAIVIVPIDLCTTDAHTTGSQPLEPRFLMSKGALYAYRYNTLQGYLKVGAESLSISLHLHANLRAVCLQLLRGFRYIKQ